MRPPPDVSVQFRLPEELSLTNKGNEKKRV